MIDPKQHNSLGDLLRDACLQYKSSTALIETDRKRETGRMTYLEFLRQGEQLATKLQQASIAEDARVAILAGNQSNWLLSAYAVFRAGGVLVPLDSKLSGPEQLALLQHVKADLLIADRGVLRQLPDGGPPAWEMASLLQDLPEAAVTEVPKTRDDLATIVYSSGTGGSPKGCMLTHGNYLTQYDALVEVFPTTPDDVFFSVLPTNHAIDFMAGFVGPFCTGGAVVHQRALRPEFLLWTMRRYRVTHMAAVPLLLKAFKRGIDEKLDDLAPRKATVFGALRAINARVSRDKARPGISKWLMKPVLESFGGRLKTIFCGGAYTDPELARFFYEVGMPVAIGYGLTEVCTVATVNDLKPFRADTVGAPVKGVHIKIANPDATGVGEVLIKGPTVFRGYLDNPELTSEVFDDDGWFLTGDLGWIDAARHLHLVGRARNLIVTEGGKNIYPEDLETHFGEIPAEDFAIFAADYVWPRQGLKGEQLFAIVRDGKDGWADYLRERNRKLPAHKRLHAVIEWPDEFPRTTSFKLKRRALAQTLRDQRERDTLSPL